MTRAEEIALIFKITEGDKDLFRQVVDTHGGMIFSVLYRMTGNREDAEDLAQETFVKAYFSLGQYRGESSISTWLYSIAYRLAVSSFRKKRRTVNKERFTDIELRQSSEWLDSGEDLEMKELRERQYQTLEKAVTELEPQDRFLITAFYEQKRSLAELSEITGMTLANVKVRLYRCRNRLARMLKDYKDTEK